MLTIYQLLKAFTRIVLSKDGIGGNAFHSRGKIKQIMKNQVLNAQEEIKEIVIVGKKVKVISRGSRHDVNFYVIYNPNNSGNGIDLGFLALDYLSPEQLQDEVDKLIIDDKIRLMSLETMKEVVVKIDSIYML